MKKLGLEDKIKVAWFRATGRDDGWEVFLSMIYKDSQEDVARAFKVATRTAARWHKEFKQKQVA